MKRSAVRLRSLAPRNCPRIWLYSFVWGLFVYPVFAGNIPQAVYPLISRVCGEQEQVVDCALNRDLDGVFNAFAADPNMCISVSDARKLFDEMVDNTKEYLKMYF